MSKTIKKATISATTTENFYDVLSSDNFTHYPLLMTGPGACVCGCIRGTLGKSCYHRTTALETLVYIFPDAAYRFQVLEEGLKKLNAVLGAAVTEAIETEFELDAVRDLFNEAA